MGDGDGGLERLHHRHNSLQLEGDNRNTQTQSTTAYWKIATWANIIRCTISNILPDPGHGPPTSYAFITGISWI